MSKAKQILVIVVVVLVIVAVAGLIVGLTTPKFYVTVNKKKITKATSGFVFDCEQTKIGVKADGEYTLKIVPNVVDDVDIQFSVDGEQHSFQEVEDLTSGFDISQDKEFFTIQPKGNLQTILQCVYPESTVLAQGYYDDMFKLIVTTNNGKDSIELCFSLSGVQGITLDQETITF